MAQEYITKIRTAYGDLPIDYNSLANLPSTDQTLKIEGKAADAYMTGRYINDAHTSASHAQTSADNAQTAARNAQTTADNAQKAANNAQTAVDKANQDIATLSERVDSLSEGAGDVDVSGLVQKTGDKMIGSLEVPFMIVATTEGMDSYPSLEFGYYQNGEFKVSNRLVTVPGAHALTFANICIDDKDKGEYYYLPVVDSGRVDNGTYQILTTKSPVSVEQGGTGANNPTDALANLGGISFVILWANVSPTSDFQNQTITVNGMSDYDMIVIESNHNVHIVVTNGTYQSMDQQRALSDTNFQTYGRNLEAYKDTSTIHFYDCYYRSTSGGTIEKANNVLIPIIIYGLKGVQI